MQALNSAALRPSPLDPLRKPVTTLPTNNAKPHSKHLPFKISASSTTVSAPKRETDPKKRVVITGMGLVSVFGNDVDAYYEKLLSGESGITAIDRFDASKFPTRFGGQIRGFKSEGYIDGKNDRRLDDCLRYCIVAGKKALENADLGGDRLNTVEIGNYDSFYEKGLTFSPEQILSLTKETRRILPYVALSVTVPHTLSLPDQIKLAEQLEQEGVDIIQTEGGKCSNPSKAGILGLIEKASPTLAAAYSISRAVRIPVMCSSGLSSVTAPMAITAGASGVGVGSAVNKLNDLVAMIAEVRSLAESLNLSAKGGNVYQASN
ncbi:hypothetical protein RD792_003922 [Penstemon davidsonii]|uniref:Uncharacterized protein ycf23 n=1 Tax=Penstemon davidsonii TaxID=160366 RepID=A0ABR0DG07_9LAMI|nr:hypothetical protein RD792_003922 [Penstemon davidsonii]